jgi:hypothetical protein
MLHVTYIGKEKNELYASFFLLALGNGKQGMTMKFKH